MGILEIQTESKYWNYRVEGNFPQINKLRLFKSVKVPKKQADSNQ